MSVGGDDCHHREENEQLVLMIINAPPFHMFMIGQMNRNHNFEDHSREKVNFPDDICIVSK